MNQIQMIKHARFVVPDYQHVHFTIVGVGGTGGFVAEYIGGIAQHLRTLGKRVTGKLIDGDIVTESNVGRSAFYPHDVGLNKATTMARRISPFMDVVSVPSYFAPSERSDTGLSTLDWPSIRNPPDITIVVGCVDNPFARQRIAKAASFSYQNQYYWIESGNHESAGRVFWGNSKNAPRTVQGRAAPLNLVKQVPFPHISHPEILHADDGDVDPATHEGCLPDMINGRQSLMVNRAMAVAVGQTITRLIVDRDIDYWKIDLSLDPFVAKPVYLTS